MEPFVEHLVVDAAGFIKYAKLENIGKIIHTLREVVDEIKDKATKERLQVLPYELHFDHPTGECLKFVTEFSKKTGDYGSLSATDLKVIALTYQLENTLVGVNHLKLSPMTQASKGKSESIPRDDVDQTRGQETIKPSSSSTPNQLPGFYKPSSQKADMVELTANALSENLSIADIKVHETNQADDCRTDKTSHTTGSEHNSDLDDEELDSDDVDDDETGWITPQNIAQINRTIQRRDPITVGCITSDFAIQNVLMHIGLNVVSTDGSIIKQLRTYLLRCHACYKTTSIMTRKFCPECGNATLKRVAVTVNEEGTKSIHISKRKTINAKRFAKSIPPFRGGKHADNPILYADQPTPQNVLSKKALQKLNVLDADYVARNSPFLDRDIYSRSALLGVRKLTSNKSKKRL